ncbi:MAG: T9SS type A sorting domain-containing protein [Bacteroidota bacterium]
MKTYYLPLLLLLLTGGLCPQLYGQCASNSYEFLDENQVKARYHNSADHFWDLQGAPAYEVPQGSGRHSAFASSLWIGGTDDNNQLRVAAQTYRQSGTDFFAGPYRSTGNYTCDVGFSTPQPVLERGLLALSSGKVAAFYANGFTVYDPTTQTTITRILPINRPVYEAVELSNGQILLYGGTSVNNLEIPLVVDTANFTVQTINNLNFAHVRSTAINLPGGLTLLAGILGCELFDPATLTATVTGSMITPRTRSALVLLPNGQILSAAGSNTIGSNSSLFTEVYNPATGQWTAGPNLLSPRYDAQMTVTAAGKVLITGGTHLALDFEEYDPLTNMISPVPGGIGEPFQEHTIFPLSNGELFISHDRAPLSNAPSLSPLARYNPTTLQVNPTQFVYFGTRAVPIAGNKVLVESSNMRFAEYDPLAEVLIDQSWQKIWKISRAEIDQFILDFNANQVNFANYPDIETWPARGDVAQGEDSYLAPFVDVNQDGEYRPLQDGDYPCVEGDQALWWVYHDDGTHTETGGLEMGLQVEQMAYVYDCGATPCGGDTTPVDYTTYHHLEITNKSERSYTGTYVGVWVDVDVGNFFDDYIGSDTQLGLAFAYNGDAVDETASGYGPNPPAIGIKFLDNGQIRKASNTMYYENDFSIRGNPTQPIHYYNYMRSLWKDATPLVAANNGYGLGLPTNWVYPGDPGFCGGNGDGNWSEPQVANSPSDRRILVSFGPFDLAAGETVDLDYAVVWARGFYNDNFGSVCELKNAVQFVDSFWQAQSQNCFNIVLDRPESQVAPVGLDLYPNPSAGQFSLAFAEALRGRAELQLFNAAGQQVHAQALAGYRRNFTVQVGDLPEGVYLVRIHGSGTEVTRKLILQR